MKSTSVLFVSQTMLTMGKIIKHEDDYTTQLQTRKIPEDETSKSGDVDVAGFLEQLPLRKMEPAELLSNEISVAELAQAVSASGKTVDDPTKKRLEQFKAFIGELEDDFHADHKADQQKIDKEHNAATQCTKNFLSSTQENNKVKQKLTAKETAHLECRKTQSQRAVSMQDACEDLKKYQKSIERTQAVPTTSDWLTEPGPTCGEVTSKDTTTFKTYFSDAMAKLETDRNGWESRSKACSDASDAVSAQRDECAAIQQEFETEFCAWRNAAYHNCYDQSQCHDGTLEEFQASIKLATERSEVRKEHFEASQHFKCFLDVLLHDKNMTDCKADVDKSVFDFDIPEEAKDPKCDLTGLYSHPGTFSWTRRYDDSECKVNEDHHECEAIPEHVLAAAASQEKNTFVRWGHSECPGETVKLFSGYASSGHYGHSGSGYNALCLHPDPTWPVGTNGGNQNGALLYGTEYQNTGISLDKNHDKDAVCVVCAVQGATFTQWGRNVCADGQRREYKGVIMANHYTQQKGEFVCVDEEKRFTAKSNHGNQDGNLWYNTEFQQGSLPSAVFKHDHEASCAQCTDMSSSDVYVRWGHGECPGGSSKLFTGYAAGSHYGHHGGGANTLCLHPEPTYPDGYHSGNQDGALIYGTEYQNTGAIDKNHDKDASCSLCAVQGTTYTLWGNNECPGGQRQEYKGLIMSTHYTQYKSSFVCVDEARQYTQRSNHGNQDGNLWYTTEFEQGSLPGDVFKHNHEASCAQCTALDISDIYVRWGSRECRSGATKLFTGYASGSHYSHNGAGANMLCLHPTPKFPEGVSSGDNNGALLYGTEYQNTGAIDKHHDRDAVCSLCGVEGATYTQWGRDICPDGHRMEYKGVIMANHYTQKKSEFVCVDTERAYTEKSNHGNQDGSLWYTTECEQGSLPGDVFKHDHEASCAQCSTAPMK